MPGSFLFKGLAGGVNHLCTVTEGLGAPVQHSIDRVANQVAHEHIEVGGGC